MATALGKALILEMHGYQTRKAYDGSAALAVAADWRPEVVLLDIGMPGVDGHDVCRRLRQERWGTSIQIIATSGWGQESDAREAIASGFDAHMTKPVDLRKLSAVVDELLLRKRG